MSIAELNSKIHSINANAEFVKLQGVGTWAHNETDNVYKSLQVNDLGQLKVDAVITGGGSDATAANQVIANSSLSNIETNTALHAPGSRSEALPVQLCVGSTGAEYNALRSVNGDLAIYIDDINIDVATNSGLSTKAVQDTQQVSLTSIDGKIATCDTDDVVIRGSVYPLASASVQSTINSTITSIESNTELKVPGSRTECLPVQLCVGTTGGSYNTLRSIGQDLSVYIDDMNIDVATNSGLSTKVVQDTQQVSLTSIDGKVVLPAALSASGNLKCSIEETGALTKTHVNLYTNGTGTAGVQSAVVPLGQRTNLTISGSTTSSGGQIAIAFLGGTSYYVSPSYAALQNVGGGVYNYSMTISNISCDSVKIHFLATCNNLYLTTSTY